MFEENKEIQEIEEDVKSHISTEVIGHVPPQSIQRIREFFLNEFRNRYVEERKREFIYLKQGHYTVIEYEGKFI